VVDSDDQLKPIGVVGVLIGALNHDDPKDAYEYRKVTVGGWVDGWVGAWMGGWVGGHAAVSVK
jgi:hypothetical protein